MGKYLGFHLGEKEGVQMVLKSNEGGEEVVDLLLRSKISSTENNMKEEERLAGARQQRESRRLDAADPHQGNREEAEEGNTTDAPAADDLTSDGNSMAVGCGEEKKISARENGGSYSTGMARKERAEVSIFPREPARASPLCKDSPARAPWEPGRGGMNPRSVWPDPGERGREAPRQPGSPTGARISNTGTCSERA
jgi:hypothetical protein